MWTDLILQISQGDVALDLDMFLMKQRLSEFSTAFLQVKRAIFTKAIMIILLNCHAE